MPQPKESDNQRNDQTNLPLFNNNLVNTLKNEQPVV